jgi:uncharacterized protein (DUF488 family)
MKLCTIGFTKKNAEEFFGRLRAAGVKRILDVRLNNTTQLAGFAKRDDLRFFAREILGGEYVHLPVLAPTQEMLDEYRKEKRGWENYEGRFRELMRQRAIETAVDRKLVEGGCLLCSEDKPHQCHRRIVAEYLREAWEDMEIVHL